MITSPTALLTFCCGVTFLLVGLLMKFKPPKAINSLYGYRTRTSMKSQEAWKYAQPYSGKLFQQLGVFHLFFTVILDWLCTDQSLFPLIVLAFVVFSLVITIYRIERHLKKKFPAQGKQK